MVAALVASESGEGVDCSKSGDGVDCSMSQCMLHGSTLSAPCTRVVWDALTVVATVVVVTMATVLVEVVIVDVGTSATNACGFTEIAPMLKCASMPMMASVEFKSSPRNDEEYNLAANSFADELVTSFTNADTWPSELMVTLDSFPNTSTTDSLLVPHAEAMPRTNEASTSAICIGSSPV